MLLNLRFVSLVDVDVSGGVSGVGSPVNLLKRINRPLGLACTQEGLSSCF